MDSIPLEGYHWLLRERAKAQTVRAVTQVAMFLGGGLDLGSDPAPTGDPAQRAR